MIELYMTASPQVASCVSPDQQELNSSSYVPVIVVLLFGHRMDRINGITMFYLVKITYTHPMLLCFYKNKSLSKNEHGKKECFFIIRPVEGAERKLCVEKLWVKGQVLVVVCQFEHL